MNKLVISGILFAVFSISACTGAGKGEEGIVFKSKTTGNYVRAFADCIVLEKL